MKQPIFIAAFLLIGLAACKSRHALAFKKTIAQQEHSALNILVNKGGAEEEKLNCLIKHDFKGAFLAADKEEQAFNNIIKAIQALPTDGIKQGDALKIAAADYYTAIKDLQLFDRKEIAQQEAAADTANTQKAAIAQQKLLQLNDEKQTMYGPVYKKRAALDKALDNFDAANNL